MKKIALFGLVSFVLFCGISYARVDSYMGRLLNDLYVKSGLSESYYKVGNGDPNIELAWSEVKPYIRSISSNIESDLSNESEEISSPQAEILEYISIRVSDGDSKNVDVHVPFVRGIYPLEGGGYAHPSYVTFSVYLDSNDKARWGCVYSIYEGLSRCPHWGRLGRLVE